MKILLLGEYSNVHTTLAEGLRELGHEVTTASNGDYWKNYPRDIDLARHEGRLGGLGVLGKLWKNRHRLTGYDVVQLINPIFVDLKAERVRPLYHWLRRHNGTMIMGAFGMDYYWVHENITRMPLRYSDFNIGQELRTDAVALTDRDDWIGTAKGKLNQMIADDCDGIVTGLYEYQVCYGPLFPDKTTFIPFPIKPKTSLNLHFHTDQPIKVFVGISKGRSIYKGTDIMLAAAQAVERQYPGRVVVDTAEGLPFAEYVSRMNHADVILDQLYSYTPAMNALEAMSRGIICVGGGEPESYEILGEHHLRPIINVQPCFESVYSELEQLVLHPERVDDLKRQSVEYIARHHDYRKVAKRYIDFYNAHGKSHKI